MRLLGIAAGFGMQVAAVGAGLDILLARWPQIDVDLRWLGAGCAAYLAWQLLRPRRAGGNCDNAPLGFAEVAALQFLNPRAWLMSLAAATLILPPDLQQVLTGGFPGRI